MDFSDRRRSLSTAGKTGGDGRRCQSGHDQSEPQGRDICERLTSESFVEIDCSGGSGARRLKLRLGHDVPVYGSEDWTNQSDHYNFYLAKVPFIYLGVGDHEDYHKPTDTFERLIRISLLRPPI